MSRLRTLRAGALAGCLVGLAVLAAGRIRAEEPRVELEVRVLQEESGEPVAQAAVYVKFKEERLLRRDKKLEWALKTNAEGVAAFPSIPEGKVLLQVVAKGWKTYGRYYTLSGRKQIIEVKLRPPTKWY